MEFHLSFSGYCLDDIFELRLRQIEENGSYQQILPNIHYSISASNALEHLRNQENRHFCMIQMIPSSLYNFSFTEVV